MEPTAVSGILRLPSLISHHTLETYPCVSSLFLPWPFTLLCGRICTQGFTWTWTFSRANSRSRIAGSCGECVFVLARNFKTVFQSAVLFYIPISNWWGFQYLYILMNTSYCLLYFSHPRGYLIVVVKRIPLILNIFSCGLWLFVYFLWRSIYSHQIFPPFY